MISLLRTVDVVVIGAGPAGVSAAVTAASYGVEVVLLDEQHSAGGQVYRNVAANDDSVSDILGEEYQRGRESLRRLHESDVDHIKGACVWRVDPDGSVVYSIDGKASSIKARHIILATGAFERPVPIPGWQLAGVMGVGAAQSLLKGQGLLPDRTILAGSGPLLYLYACQLVRAGAPPIALLETQTFRDQMRSLKYLRRVLHHPAALKKGKHWLDEIKQAGIPRYRGVSNLRVRGSDRAEGIAFDHRGKHHVLNASTILLHQGVVPNTQMTRSLRVDHDWNSEQRCFQPSLDANGGTSLSTISVAGDSARILGADAAVDSGVLAALNALRRLGVIDEMACSERARSHHRNLERFRSLRCFLDALYPVPEALTNPDDAVVVCRCESVTVSTIKRAVRAGCIGPNQAKAFHRCGMGPCQGRYCGLTVTTIIAAQTSQSEQDVGYYRIRAPLKPVTLGELASLANDSEP